MILLPLLLSAACGIHAAENCVRAAVQQHMSQTTLVQASRGVELQSMPMVDSKRLPVVYVDGVPWTGDRGNYQAGPLRVPGMGVGYGFVHKSAEGRVSGVFVGRFDHAVVSGRPGEELQFQPFASQQASMIPGCDPAFQGRVGPPVASVVTPPPMERPACGIRPLTLAVESDLQFYQRFGDVERATVWLTLGVLQAQHALRRDLSVELEVPYMGLHVSEDPWSMPDVDGSAGSMLHEFRTLWPGLAPVSTQLSHFVSGVGNGLSLAGQSGICDPAESYAVHTSRLDSNQEPDGRIFSLALLHGLGHNLGARHADWYCPPLDTCSAPATNSDCPGFRDCSATGTIMGSCHLCPGGLDRVEARFHPVNVATMEAQMEACLPHRSPVSAGGPSSRVPGEPWTIQLETRLTLLEAPRLQFWGDSVAGEVSMTPQGGGAFLAHLPPASCGQRTYAQVVLETMNCGTVVWPEPGLQSPMETLTMEQVPALVDDMSVNRGWISLQNGASRGFWTRAIPIADPD
ncbi:MAG: M12 family metallo-peptidase, partial [Planctomycetota bacterium]|nr:M12 family metallo-peptidase [Planctomycetota bacterium]